MKVLPAFADGIQRVNRAPALLAGVYLVSLLLALPMGLALRGLVHGHLGASLAADAMAAGVNYDWWQEFGGQAVGLGTTFTPSIIGFSAVLDNLSGLLDAEPPPAVVLGAAAAHLLAWLFLLGGILDRYGRNRPTRAPGFFAASGVFFFRFCRLAILAGIAYALLFGYVHGWLFDRLYGWATRDLAVERTAFLVRLTLYGLFGALLVVTSLVFDYAKVRAVVEDRRSMVGALVAAVRFVARRPVATLGLYGLNGLAYALVLLLYAAAAPGAGGAGWSVWPAFLVGQAYVIARLWTKLLFYASETAYFQGELAHAGYVAAPVPVWPESPAVEAVTRP